MRKNILTTIYAFVAGISHQEKVCSTDGKVLKSYNLIIARKDGDGYVLLKESIQREYIIPNTPSFNRSKTTLSHIKAVHSVLKGKIPPRN